MFSRTLNVELAKSKIHVQCQVPMFVTTKLAKLKKASLFVATTQAYARAAVAAIGDHDFATPPTLIDRLQSAWASNPVQPI